MEHHDTILVVGAGLSGTVISRELAEAGYRVHVIDKRSHVAGNCHTGRDEETGIMMHHYGPHVFHTNDAEVWEYVNKHEEFHPYVSRIKTTVGGKIYSLPINLHTINQFFGKALRPDEAKEFLQGLTDHSMDNPETFEEQALKLVGRELYEAFFKGYTTKQWGISPTRLPASILKRLPVRFDYNDNYFFHRFQGMPRNGYTSMVEKIMTHENISVTLNCSFDRSMVSNYRHTFYSGPIDAFFEHSEGRLGYRTLDFEVFRSTGDYQGIAIMNFGDAEVPYTRISEHKHFAPWEKHEKTIYCREYSRECGENDIPYYPIRLVEEQNMLKKYEAAANDCPDVTFVGRLGTYRYLDMDATIREALDSGTQFLASQARR
ncbi:MAG: UDP-galactopyranose mutase [Verrucomicrobiota bacterium]